MIMIDLAIAACRVLEIAGYLLLAAVPIGAIRGWFG